MKGLLDYEIATGGNADLRAARLAGAEYLLERRLLFGLRSGELVGPWATRFAYPFRSFYSALNVLNHLVEAAVFESGEYDGIFPDGVALDPRAAEAFEVVRSARQADGTWVQERRHPGRVWFEVDVAPGEPSPWLTYYGTRVLNAWDGAPRP